MQCLTTSHPYPSLQSQRGREECGPLCTMVCARGCWVLAQGDWCHRGVGRCSGGLCTTGKSKNDALNMRSWDPNTTKDVHHVVVPHWVRMAMQQILWSLACRECSVVIVDRGMESQVPCNAHWKCLPDLGIGMPVRDQQLSWCNGTRADSTRTCDLNTRYNDTWSPLQPIIRTRPLGSKW